MDLSVAARMKVKTHTASTCIAKSVKLVVLSTLGCDDGSSVQKRAMTK